MRISEIFHSIQGEGKLTGIPSVFIRVSGCNLRCTWCDTPYASWNPEGPDIPLEQIVEKALAYNCRHVVLTGGEPMMFKELVVLITALKTRGIHITVETAGTLWLEGLPQNSIDLASISPKLANSTPWQREEGRFAQAHEKNRLNLETLRLFASGGRGVIKDRQFKFVVAAEGDLPEIESLIGKINADVSAENKIQPHDILLMPEGTDAQILADRGRWVADLCKRKGYRFCPRLHVHLYGNTKGT